MKMLIIGGTGFISGAVVRALSAQGHELTVFHRGKTDGELPNSVSHLLGDRQHLSDFAAEFRRIAPDVVVDTVPMSERDAQLVMETFKGIAGRVVALSSGDVYHGFGLLTGFESGPIEPLPLSEDAPLRRQFYLYRGSLPGRDDYEKILVERVVMGDPDLPGTILRLPMVYGPGDRQRRWHAYLKRMDDRRPAIILDEGMAQWRGSRGYVDSVAEAVAQAAGDERAAGQIYNVADPDTPAEAEWVRLIGRIAGWQGEIVSMPSERLPEHLRANMRTEQHLIMDSTRIRRELGYAETISREEALHRTIAWERAHTPAEIDPKRFDYAAEDAALAADATEREAR